MIKLGLLLGTALSNPREFVDRLEAVLTVKLDNYYSKTKTDRYSSQSAEDVLSTLSLALAQPLRWDGLEEITTSVWEKVEELEHKAPFTTAHHGDTLLAKVCYAACRLLKPEVVVETGTAYGVN